MAISLQDSSQIVITSHFPLEKTTSYYKPGPRVRNSVHQKLIRGESKAEFSLITIHRHLEDLKGRSKVSGYMMRFECYIYGTHRLAYRVLLTNTVTCDPVE